MIYLAKPQLGEEEKKAVCDVIDSGLIANGAVVTEFENQFAQYIGCEYGIATTSGTTALEVALRAFNITEGDKVLTTPFSFIATANAIIYVGATPVFIDVESDSYNLSAEAIDEALKKDNSIKAVILVHLFGRSCDMNKIVEVINKHNVILIEDCAQSHGSEWAGKKTGSFGHASCFSFYPTKNMTTSEGGIVLTHNKALAERARLLINHGMKIRYHHEIVGYNYRMTNISAAIGICQLKKLSEMNEKRRLTAEYYNKYISNEFIQLPSHCQHKDHVYHQYTIRVKFRKAFLQHLENNEVGYGVFYPITIPEQECYKKNNFQTDYPVADILKKEVVSLPIHPGLTKKEIETVVEIVNAFKGK